MTSPPRPLGTDPAEITQPKDPAAYRPKPLLGATFWAMIVLMLLCVLAGVAIADFGPRLFGPKPAAKTTLDTPAPGETSPASAAAPTSLASAVAPPPPPAPSADVGKLSARVATLESQQSHAAPAAAAALAASAVVEASQGTGPFADELSSLRAISPPSPELQALARLAQAGAPSRTALAATYPDYAARAASAARAPGSKAGLGERIVYELSRVVTLRRVGEPSGDGVDAVLARAERQVDDGDLDKGLRTLDRLPAGARDAMAPWRARAERRAEIDRNAEALRARALQTLAAQARGGA
ncbi:MAG: COG4223 family protein [Phenylobacterium sp.]